MPVVCSAEKIPAVVVVELSLICCATVVPRTEQTEPESIEFHAEISAPFRQFKAPSAILTATLARKANSLSTLMPPSNQQWARRSGTGPYGTEPGTSVLPK